MPPGVVVSIPVDRAPLAEAGGTNQYRLALSLNPTGEVNLEIQADPGLEVSIDKGAGVTEIGGEEEIVGRAVFDLGEKVT